MIDLIGKSRLQIAKRIVGQGCQMKDPVEPNEVIDIDIASVLADSRHVADFAAGRICTA